MAWADGALPWLAGLLACCALVVGICSWPLRFDLSARAKGEADGSWFVAGGASISVLSLTFVWARGVPAKLTFLLFGHKLGWRPRWGRRPKKTSKRPPQSRPRKGWPRIDPLDFALKVLEERRHFNLRYLVVDLAYGFRDPLLTGRLVGALSILSAVLPSRVELRQRPRWDFEDGWEIGVDGRAIARPWLVALDLAAYVVRTMISRRRPQVEALPSQGPREIR
jgi:hypothetical protein